MKTAHAIPFEATAAAPVLEHLATLSDAIRCRMLLLLERHELTVTEVCAVLQLPQSTVSRHLKTLADARWVTSRRDGTSRFYTMSLEELDGGARRLWPLIREQVAVTPAAEHDDRRLKSVLARRRTKSEEFFSTAAGQWDRLRDELFGNSFHLHALLGLLDPTASVGDLGCGTGELSRLLAPHVSRLISVDSSPEMLQAARRNLAEFTNVELRAGALEALPIDNRQLDLAVMALVLHHLPDPGVALADAARVLRPGGRLLVIDMLPHDRAEYQQQMGHVWLGFSEAQVRKQLAAAGFDDIRLAPLPIDERAKGPSLFAAVATRRDDTRDALGAGQPQRNR